MDGNTRICKKCLLREMDEAGFFQNSAPSGVRF